MPQEKLECPRCAPLSCTEAAKAEVLNFLRWNYSDDQREAMLADIEVSKELVFDHICRESGETLAAIMHVTKYRSCQVSLVRTVLREQQLLHEQSARVDDMAAVH